MDIVDKYRQTAFNLLTTSTNDNRATEETQIKCMNLFISRGYDVNQRHASTATAAVMRVHMYSFSLAA